MSVGKLENYGVNYQTAVTLAQKLADMSLREFEDELSPAELAEQKQALAKRFREEFMSIL